MYMPMYLAMCVCACTSIHISVHMSTKNRLTLITLHGNDIISLIFYAS